MVSNHSNCQPNTWNQERLLPYISIDLFDEENQNASLQHLVDCALNEEKQMLAQKETKVRETEVAEGYLYSNLS